MDYLKTAKDVLILESKALVNAANKLENLEIQKLIGLYQELRASGGHLVFTGVGKSGIIAMKLASTFSSLGLPSFFLHPVEALHGDLGRFRKGDALVILSKSGATEEILKLLPYLDIDKSTTVGLLGVADSPLAKYCGINFDCSVEKEACINNQAPTTSSTLALAMGDAMAVVYEHFVGLSKENFAVNHPGGLLGKALRLKVKNLMNEAADCPSVTPENSLQDVILEMTRRPLGGCAVLDDHGLLLGIIVEGDIRRAFTRPGVGLQTKAIDIMAKKPIATYPEELAYEALRLMEEREKPITILPVIDQSNRFLGLIRLHDLLREGFSPLKK